MPNIRDFMSPDPIVIPYFSSLEETEEIFVDNRLTVAPVVAPWGDCVGVVSDFKLVKMFLRRASVAAQGVDVKELNISYFLDELEPVVTIDENEPITNAFRLIIQSPNHRIFAVSGGKLCGALSPKDLIPFLAGDNRNRNNPNEKVQDAQKKIQALIKELNAAKSNVHSYKNIIDSSPFMMHSVDWDGKILLANKMLHMVLGYENGELIGRHMRDIYPPQFHQEIEAGLARIRSVGFHPLVSSLMVKKDKFTLKVDLASTLRRNEQGIAIGTISIARPSETENMLDVLRQAASTIKIP